MIGAGSYGLHYDHDMGLPCSTLQDKIRPLWRHYYQNTQGLVRRPPHPPPIPYPHITHTIIRTPRVWSPAATESTVTQRRQSPPAATV